MAEWARDGVLRAIVGEFFGLIDGAEWATAERIFWENPSKEQARKMMRMSVPISRFERDFLGSVKADVDRITRESPDQRAQLIAKRAQQHLGRPIGKGLVNTPRVAKPPPTQPRTAPDSFAGAYKLTRFALQLASAPLDACSAMGDQIMPALRELLAERVLARVARAVVLFVDTHCGRERLEHELYAGWDWGCRE
jgi:hypothetical protein